MARALDAAHQLMSAGVSRGVFPGAVLAVSRGDDIIFQQAYGQADLFSRRAMEVDTCFDLASLTKPLATVPAVMELVRQCKLDLDLPCGEVCPALDGSDKVAITIRQLLRHASGLPPWKPFFMRLRHLPFEQRRSALQAMVRHTPLSTLPGQRSEYSDLGYMALQWVVESVTKTDLWDFLRRRIYEPLEISDLFFTDTRREVEKPRRFAATQMCPWRNRLMLGHVDDDNAFIVGGIGGHAGLFGTAAAVSRLLQTLSAAEHGEGGRQVFDARLVRQFFSADRGERWALGFDTPSASKSSAGHYFPPDSMGHLGFTGTSFWLHRRKRIVVVLLTNRVHPWRFNAGIKEFRPRLHDAVMAALG